MKLLAARSWRYDRQLEQYNTAEPKPEQIKALLEKLGQQQIKPVIADANAPQNTDANNVRLEK